MRANDVPAIPPRITLEPAPGTAQRRGDETRANEKDQPVLLVEEIEPCMKFWVERLGFEKTVEVPDGNTLGFIILRKGNVEIMYQTFASAAKDVSALEKETNIGPTFLYVEVGKLDPILDAMKGANVFLPVRTTFYGAKEIGVKDPAGHFVVFAEMNAAPQH